MDLWFCLSEKKQQEIARYYEKQFGMKLVPPKWDKRAIHCEPKIESLEEIDQIIRKVPPYTIDVQGREG